MVARFHVGFLLYPNLTQLDLTGPAQVLHRMPGAALHYVWKSLAPVPSDCGLELSPTTTLGDCPPLDLLCVPGGYGCTAVMGDEEVLGWLRAQAARARFVTSVCTGSLVLAAAGLLEGYRAGCHWAWGEQLPLFGAVYAPERTVVDRNRITAGGVTSGIDFAFRIVEQLHGPDVAEGVRLVLEYDPEARPGGTPGSARPEVLARVRAAMTARGLPVRQAEVAALATARHSSRTVDAAASPIT